MEAQSPPSKISRIVPHGKAAAASMKCGFTLMQLQELEQQSLIYNYIEAGIPIPSYLVWPIWKSFARLIPNFVCYNPLYCDTKSSMDQEPNRCRRTDGKKWRCSKNVVEGQKYCHKHLCRGRLHSRNHLQPNAAAAEEMVNVSDILSETNLSTFSTNN